MKTILKPVCSDCGSENVEQSELTRHWNIETQKWVLNNDFENYCYDCGSSGEHDMVDIKKPTHIIKPTSAKNFSSELKDQSDNNAPSQEISINTDVHQSGAFIYASGYTDFSSVSGCIALVELYEGELMIHVYADCNDEQPTHIIKLNGAKTSNKQQ